MADINAKATQSYSFKNTGSYNSHNATPWLQFTATFSNSSLNQGDIRVDFAALLRTTQGITQPSPQAVCCSHSVAHLNIVNIC